MLGNVAEAKRALARLTNYERTRADGPRAFDLARPAGLFARLGAPHTRLGSRVIQVAGTKGKGSTARFVESILRATGLATGLFISPHLEDVRERIAVNGRMIGEKDFTARVDEVLQAVDGDTTFFEAMLATACLQFAAAGTDAVVLEVGLGGRLDATTAVPTTHTIITEISRDHTEILGDTLESIAAEKAGTIRTGVPVSSGVDPQTAPGAVIARIAAERDAPLRYVPPPPNAVADAEGLRWGGLRLSVLGLHQVHNAALAASVCTDLDEGAVARGLSTTVQPGCCELRGGVILDGAHTVSSIHATLRAVHDHFPGARPALVFALAADKDLDTIARALAPHVGAVFCTRADERRGNPAEVLAAHPAWCGRARAVPDPREALLVARGDSGPDGLVLATGSLYLAGMLRSRT